MIWLGNLVNINVEQHPVIGGILISVFMGMILTLPISSAAIGVSMGMRNCGRSCDGRLLLSDGRLCGGKLQRK